MDRIDALETALDITSAGTDLIEVDGARRLTGPGMLWDYPGAIIDLFFKDDVDGAKVEALWNTHARRVLDAIGWPDQHLISRRFNGGINVAISAPMDQLYSAIFVAETAWHFCAADIAGEAPGPFDLMISDLKTVMSQEANPALIDLIAAADAHGIDILCDDDHISLGHGTGSKTWAYDALPAPDDVDWEAHHDIPVAFITGTNGKTTTTRLCTAIARASGQVSGLTSTDKVQVGDDVLDYGDYSGPGGARMLLRDPRLQIACLEVARGGILRRGLPTRRARAALVTNVANDHLGQYGVNTVPELAEAKFAVHRTLGVDGILSLNADDPFVVAEAARVDKEICWFSLDPENPKIAAAKAKGALCAYLSGDDLIFFDGHKETLNLPVSEVPVTLNGAARYNVLNVLAAISVTKALGIDEAAIRNGLMGFKPDPKDNPGRCNEFAYKGARVFVDFAHNPHSISAVCSALGALPSKRRFITLSHAGDRTDDDIRGVTETAMQFRPDVLVATELEDYLRGEVLGVVPEKIAKTALAEGLTPDQIWRANSPLEATKMILAEIKEDDVALLLVASERDAIFELLSSGG